MLGRVWVWLRAGGAHLQLNGGARAARRGRAHQYLKHSGVGRLLRGTGILASQYT